MKKAEEKSEKFEWSDSEGKPELFNSVEEAKKSEKTDSAISRLLKKIKQV